MINKEIWRDLPGYEGFYLVSSKGKIKNANTNRVLKGRSHPFGYKMFTACKNGNHKTMTIHSAVATAFFGSRPKGHDIHHVDGNVLNNKVENLEYVSRKKHINTDRVGERHGRAKLSDRQVENIRSLYATGHYTYQSLADMHNVTTGAIAPIITGKSRTSAKGIVTENNIPKGRVHHNSKLDKEKIKQIRKMKLEGVKQKDIAAHFGVTPSVISVILSGKAWKHVR